MTWELPRLPRPWGAPVAQRRRARLQTIFRLPFLLTTNGPAKTRNCIYRLLGIKRSGMRITHSEGEHLVVLSDAEAAALVDASALLVVAAQSIPRAALPPGMATVLGQLFDGLKASAAIPATAEQGN